MNFKNQRRSQFFRRCNRQPAEFGAGDIERAHAKLMFLGHLEQIFHIIKHGYYPCLTGTETSFLMHSKMSAVSTLPAAIANR